jgi:hypothetical protein
MGQAKRDMEAAEERGFHSLPQEHVCGECFDDSALAGFISENAEATQCDYCGRTADTPIAAPTDAVMETIVEGLNSEYLRAIDELWWESREGGWQGATTWATWDLFEHLGWPFVNDQLAQDVLASIGNRARVHDRRDQTAVQRILARLLHQGRGPTE